MGWPFFGETLHWLIQGSHFHSSRRQRYGAVFKTHLLGKPVVRVSGAENVRKILLGEHSLVSAQWPLSTQILLGSHTLLNARAETHRQRRKILARVFSRAALEVYLPRIQRLVSWELRGWCRRPGPIAVYASAKALTFRIAARILLGLRLEEEQFEELSGAFEQLVENLFCLPLNVPFSGLRKGIKARDLLHTYMEKAILEKLQRKDPEAHHDALDFIINSAKEYGKDFTMQELKGYQIPKGWSVMYSIRDTHETAGIYQSPPDTFDPERFWVSPEDRENHKTSASLRFHYIPFGGGVRNCIGKELAQVILKMLAIELVSTASWELATTHFPKMQTVPIVHPVDGLQLYFHSLKAGHESSGTGKDA